MNLFPFSGYYIKTINMTQEEHLTQSGKALRGFNALKDRLRSAWGRFELNYGNYFYGWMALAVIALFAFTIYLLRGMVQFI
jgi:hypothetical protein